MWFPISRALLIWLFLSNLITRNEKSSCNFLIKVCDKVAMITSWVMGGSSECHGCVSSQSTKMFYMLPFSVWELWVNLITSSSAHAWKRQNRKLELSTNENYANNIKLYNLPSKTRFFVVIISPHSPPPKNPELVLRKIGKILIPSSTFQYNYHGSHLITNHNNIRMDF